MKRVYLLTVCIFVLPCFAEEAPKNVLLNGAVTASSVRDRSYSADKAVDGLVDNTSRWLSDNGPGPHTLEVVLPQPATIGAVQLLSGWQQGRDWRSPVRSFKVEFFDGEKWRGHWKATVKDNRNPGWQGFFEEGIYTEKIRLTVDDKGPVRVVELRTYELGKPVPPLFEKPKIVFTSHPVFVNQSGYNLTWPKRFTAPLVKDRASFIITRKGFGEVLYQGTVERGVGDFTDFQPTQRGVDYVISVFGGDLKSGLSDPFRIEPDWMQRVSLEPALRFMQDVRSVVGTHPSAYGGSPFRDGTYYSFETPSLILMYQACSDYFESLPIEIDFQAEKERILDPDFSYVKIKNDLRALDNARRYYRELDPPVGERVPDIISVIHWGIGNYTIDPESRDPSGDPLGRRVHGQTIEQLAFFLYGYPRYKQYFTGAFYDRVKAVALEHWESSGLFEVIEVIGSFKGRHCPGHSIMPNLMMYKVTGDKRFLDAARHQTQWVIERLDWQDPTVTKGQRMSEHKLMSGLVMYLKHYPQQAPAGLFEKLVQWAEVMIARSDNMWDFRKYDEKDWSLPRFTPGSHGGGGWNEPGNVAGFPGICFAVAEVLQDKAKQQRLKQIGVAHIDNLFGRNPLGAHSAYTGPEEFVGVERGWPKKFPDDRCARLELVRGTFNSSCSTEHYPFHPDQGFRHVEGWTAFNAAWNFSLSILCQQGLEP